MLHRIYSTLPKFKEITFTQGLNIIVAKQSIRTTEKDTKNGSGKSSFVRIVDFLLGGECNKGHNFFLNENLVEETFGMEITLNNKRICIERSGRSKSNFYILPNDKTIWENWPYKPRKPKGSERYYFTHKDWKSLLGQFYYNLDNLDTEFTTYIPKFRSLISYFVRKIDAQAFLDPFKQNEKQNPSEVQIFVSYLLGLNWEIPRRLKQEKAKEKMIKDLKKAAKEGNLFPEIIEASATLQSKITVKTNDYDTKSRNLKDFKVLEEYHNLEDELNNLTQETNRMLSLNISDQNYLGNLESAITEEAPPDEIDIIRLFEEANILLPEIVSTRVEEVKKFHSSIIRNRKTYIDKEILKVEKQLIDRQEILKQKEDRRVHIWDVLETHGALEHYQKLQEEVLIMKEDINHLKQKHVIAKDLEKTTNELKYAITKITLDLQQDYDENDEIIDNVALSYSNVFNELYNQSCEFSIIPTDKGPNFVINTPKDLSTGIMKMKIFTFDLMLMNLWKNKKQRPPYLIHDSHIFDGVDIRQRYHALRIGQQISKDSFQYIVLMNIEDLPSSDDIIGLSDDQIIDVHNYVCDPVLTDEEEGGIFGIRFD